MSDAAPVVVVGAGPVGVATALMLAQRGIATLVVERHAGAYPLPRAVHLDDETFRILQSMGVAEAFAEITQPALGLRLVDAQLRTMAEFSRSAADGPQGYPPANMFDQPELENLLRTALADKPLATLASSTELVGFTQEPGDDGADVKVTLRAAPSGEERTVRASALLGCDGANSTVAPLIGASYEDLGFEERWLVVDVRCDRELDLWQGVYQVCDPRRAGTYMQVRPGRYRWEFRLHDGETVDSLVESGVFRSLIEPWLGDIPYDSIEIVRRAEYTFRARIADRWRDRRVFLLGDAAHLTPPFVGQGLCAGLRDAANLSWKLAAVLQGQASESLLATYEPERAPHARALIIKARNVGFVMTGGQDAVAHVRRVALALACRIPGLSDKVLDTNPPRFGDGPAVQRTGRRDKVTGGLIPQPSVQRGAESLRLDDVLGDGYAVVVRGRPDAALVSAAGTLGAPVVSVGAGGVDSPELLRWLAGAKASAVLVRPDRVVQMRDSASGNGSDLAARLLCWAGESGWRATSDVASG